MGHGRFILMIYLPDTFFLRTVHLLLSGGQWLVKHEKGTLKSSRGGNHEIPRKKGWNGWDHHRQVVIWSEFAYKHW